MRKLAIVLLLLLAGLIGKSQIYQCDSSAYYPSVYEQRYRMRPEEVDIIIQDSVVRLTIGDTVSYTYKIVDTLPMTGYQNGRISRMFTIVDMYNKDGNDTMTIVYFNGVVESIAFIKEEELMIYHVKFISKNG